MWPAGHQFTMCPAIFPQSTIRISLFVVFGLDFLGGKKKEKYFFSKKLIGYILI